MNPIRIHLWHVEFLYLQIINCLPTNTYTHLRSDKKTTRNYKNVQVSNTKYTKFSRLVAESFQCFLLHNSLACIIPLSVEPNQAPSAVLIDFVISLAFTFRFKINRTIEDIVQHVVCIYICREMMIVFVYDTEICQDESDDPVKAVLYFHPSWVSDSQKLSLCGQLMGTVQFLRQSFSKPKIMSLQNGKFVLKEFGRFVLVVGTLNHFFFFASNFGCLIRSFSTI